MKTTPNDQGPLNRFFLRLGKLSLGVLLVLAAGGFMEAAVRIVWPPPEPGHQINTAQDLRRRFLIDTRRDRTPFTMFGKPPYNGPAPGPKAEGEYRVVVLGGSTVEQGNPAVPEILEQELRKHGIPRASVFNYGVVGSQSGQELARIVFDVSDLKPDLVVQYNGANDLVSPFIGDPRPGYPFDFIVWENNPLLKDEGEYPALALLLYGSAALRKCCGAEFVEHFTHLSAMRQQVGFESDEWQEKNARAYVDNLVKGYRVSRAFGADYLGVFQPLVYFKNPRTPKEEAMFDDRYAPAVLAGRLVIQRLFAELKQNGTVGEHNLVDLSNAFDGITEDVFWNAIHHEQKFENLIGEKIRDEVLALRARPAPP